MRDEEMMYVSAVRYALGRMTYTVSAIVEFMMRQELSDNCMRIMVRDITEELERGGGGMLMDRENWLKLSIFLSDKLQKK